ncbi:hypothetical protein ACO0LG_06075 [Undibacterium sp. Ji42W]|uniref:hypothetical protein n=1 Tax=Undibacterium sp. Ji42W TaxID=3413039 RepID=UPI003BF01EA1
MINLEQYREEFFASMDQNLSFLEMHGYVYKGVTFEYSNALGSHLAGAYKNVSANRFLEILFFPPGLGIRESAVARIGLVSPEALDSFDYMSTGHLKIRGSNFCDLNGSFSERLLVYLVGISATLNNEYLDVLKGERWESDQFDWQDLK